ncbi:MAG: TetR/AcrR family transcriptional regulator [Myxococcales bacterium]|nr:TetR/AcrR family transcriptional regulator [Myxococcales bacterium]
MPTSRAQKKEMTRQRILDAALAQCADRGFVGLRTAEVARATGVSHGAVFSHFPTREELVDVTVATVGRAISDRLHAELRGAAGLREILTAHLAAIREHEEHYRWLAIEWPNLPPQVQRAWLGIQSAISYHLHAAAERARARGEIREVPQHLLFNTWIALVHHYLIHRELFAPGRSVLDERGAELIDHFLYLLSTAPTRASDPGSN